MTPDERESLLDFPCQFAVKAMGAAEEQFESLVVEIVRRHAGDLTEGAVSNRPSKNGKYVSITVNITATSQQQIDAIYQELHAAEAVLMTL